MNNNIRSTKLVFAGKLNDNKLYSNFDFILNKNLLTKRVIDNVIKYSNLGID